MSDIDTAIVLIEFQNDFCAKDGALYEAVKDVITKNNVLTNTRDLLDKAKGKCKIVYVPISYQEGYPEIGKNAYGILKGVKDARAFIKGNRGTEIYEGLKPQDGDIIVEGKRTLCAMQSSNLDIVLRANGIKKVAFVGFLTNVCVESTARTAYDKGYEVYVLSDCTAATSMEEQEFAIEKVLPMFSKVVTHNDFIENVLENKDSVSAKDKAYY